MISLYYLIGSVSNLPSTAAAEFSQFTSLQSPSVQLIVAATEPISSAITVGKSSSSLKSQGSFYLDPLVVTEIDYDDREEEEPPSQTVDTEAVSSQYKDYTVTKEGYKSFRGGWIEGVTDNNDIYYYNIHTGQSSWNLPDLLEKEQVASSPEFHSDGNNASYPDDGTDGQAYWDESQPTSYDYAQADYQLVPASDSLQPYDNYDSQWTMSEALGIGSCNFCVLLIFLYICNIFLEHIDDFIPPKKPRSIPTYPTLEVQAYSKKEGVSRQMVLLETQDRWQNALVKTQHLIAEQQAKFMDKRREMFDKVTKRVENRLNVFVEDIKFMQKVLKKELGEANATERDLRRLFEEDSGPNDSQGILKAEKLSFILESLEKFKVHATFFTILKLTVVVTVDNK